MSIDNRVGEGLETAWALHNFTRILDVVNPRVVYLVTMESCMHR